MKLLLQLADTLVDKGHAHAPSIKQWVEEVDATYKDFSSRMDLYRARLEQTLGIQAGEKQQQQQHEQQQQQQQDDRHSDPSLDAKLKAAAGTGGSEEDLKKIKELHEEKRRSARRKE